MKLEDDLIVTQKNALTYLTEETKSKMNDFVDEYEIIIGRPMTPLDMYLFQMYVDRNYRTFLVDDNSKA